MKANPTMKFLLRRLMNYSAGLLNMVPLAAESKYDFRELGAYLEKSVKWGISIE